MIERFSNPITKYLCAFTFLGTLFSAASSMALETEECTLEVDWTSIYESGPDTLTGWDIAYDLDEDAEGNIYMCGVESIPRDAISNTHSKWRVEKFAPDGTSLWIDKWPNDNVSYDNEAKHLALMPDGGIVVAGHCSIKRAIAVRRYDPAGNALWTATFSGEGYEEWQGTCVVANELGEIYVAGRAYLGWVLLKLAQDGSTVWIKKPFDVGDAMVWDMAMSPSGDVVASGDYREPGISWRFMVMRFDPSGSIKWIWKHEAPLLSNGEGGLVMDPERGYFYASGASNGLTLMKFKDDPEAVEGAPEWMGTYSGVNLMSIDIDSAGRIWGAGYSTDLGGKWAIVGFGEDISSVTAPPIVCGISDYDWIDERGLSPRRNDEGSFSHGFGIVCTQDGGVASCGFFWVDSVYAMSGETVKLLPAALHGTGPGPVAVGNPGTPGPDHPGGLKPGDVRVAGGSRGLVDPRRGEGASVSVYPTSAGTVVLTVIDRKGGVVKQVSAPATGSGTVTLTWDGKNASGAPVAPGIYAVRVEGPGIKQISKVAVVY